MAQTEVSIIIRSDDITVQYRYRNAWDNDALHKARDIRQALQLGLPQLVAQFGESSGEAQHVRETIAALEKL